jgi:hypothetical protein
MGPEDPLVCEEDSSGQVEPLAPVDPRINYPSYVSFDKFIDVERLRSLDSYVRRRVEKHILQNADPQFYTGPYTQKEGQTRWPGSRMIYLSESGQPDNYFDLDRAELWKPTRVAETEFTLLMEFIATLPFESTGRMIVLYDDEPREIPAHRDHTEIGVLHEFIWMRTNLDKPFFMLDCVTGEKLHVRGYSAWFDSVNQFHGSEPTDKLAYSVRVDGRFTEAFRQRIPRPPFNAASTPSYWASFIEQGAGFFEQG